MKGINWPKSDFPICLRNPPISAVFLRIPQKTPNSLQRQLRNEAEDFPQAFPEITLDSRGIPRNSLKFRLLSVEFEGFRSFPQWFRGIPPKKSENANLGTHYISPYLWNQVSAQIYIYSIHIKRLVIWLLS